MNRIKLSLLALTIFSLAAISCNKDDDQGTTIEALTASKSTGISQGEPVNFAFNKVADGTAVTWTIDLPDSATVVSSGRNAVVRFGGKGNFKITATAGSETASKTVTVTGTQYIADSTAAGTKMAFKAADKLQIKLAKSIRDSAGVQVVDIRMVTQTDSNYNCLSNQLLTYVNKGSNYNVKLAGVFVPAGCSSGATVKASSYTKMMSLQSDTNIVVFDLNGMNYTGKFVRSGSSVSVIWPDSSVVKINPKTF